MIFDAERATKIYKACSRYMLGYDAFAIIQQAYKDDPDNKKGKEEKIRQAKNLKVFEAELRHLLEERLSAPRTSSVIITLDYSEMESEDWAADCQTIRSIERCHPQELKLLKSSWPVNILAVPVENFAESTTEDVLDAFETTEAGKNTCYSGISAIICRKDNTELWKKFVSHCDADLVSMAVSENPDLLQMQNLRKIDKYITQNIERWEKSGKNTSNNITDKEI